MRAILYLPAVIGLVWLIACTRPAAPAPVEPGVTTPARPKVAAADAQKKWEDLLAAGKKEGTVTIYGEITPGTRDALVEGFEAKYGIKLDFVIGRSNEMAVRWDREHASGINQPDIFFMGGGTSILSMKPKGAFQPIEPFVALPEARDPKAWPGGSIRFLDNDRTVIPLTSAWTSYTGVNTNLVKEGDLKSYKDILKPEWKGKVILFDPSRPGAGAGWATFMITDAFGLEGGKDFMRQLAATRPVVLRDVRQAVEFVSKGAYAIGIGVQHALTVEFKQMGAPITINRFVEGGNINPGSACVELSAKPPHPNAAAVFLNWLLSREGQIASNRATGNPPVRLDAAIEGIDPTKMARPGDKAFLTDEKFYKTQGEAMKIAGEIFAPLLK